ncbi:Craniofacial development protein 2, partial [Lamellibrachia satsuma]
IMNTFFKLHARRLYTWRSPDKVTRNQIDYIMCTTRWRSSVRRVTTLPGADCGTDHNLLIADIKIKLKRIKRT